MLKMDEDIDLIIPRGSNAFVRYIMENSSIPVLGHSDGVCHVYVDADCDAQMAARIVADAKTQYPAACNAAEMLLVHSGQLAGALPVIAQGADGGGRDPARGRAAPAPRSTRAGIASEAADESDWGREYLALTMAVHTVDSIDEAIAFINKHGSHHTDCIITRDEAAAGKFFALVDSAGRVSELLDALRRRLSLRLRRGGRHFHRQDSRARPDGAGGALLLQVHSARTRRYRRRFRGGAAQLHASESSCEEGNPRDAEARACAAGAAVHGASVRRHAAEQTEARRVVYLTFDDGPKKDTPELLETLETSWTCPRRSFWWG